MFIKIDQKKHKGGEGRNGKGKYISCRQKYAQEGGEAATFVICDLIRRGAARSEILNH